MAEKDATARLRRAVKENNLFIVKRLIQRTDMRNPDPAPRRYTSLAWAAVLGHEETFEFLMTAGHDDAELSKDSENNTILMLLADHTPATSPTSRPSNSTVDVMGAALRMARLYYDRYPDILDWSNVHGKTALHIAALKGHEELVRMLCDFGADVDLSDNKGNTPLHYASSWGHSPVVQLLIERGCQYAAKNNEGFTASDYAYSFSTKDTLQDTARLQFENNKKTRRTVFTQAAARGNEWGGFTPSNGPPPVPSKDRDYRQSPNRMRSGSGTSRTTTTSDSGELDSNGLAPAHRSQSSSSSPSAAPHSFLSPHATNGTSPSPSSSMMRGGSPLHPPPSNTSSLSPVASRMRERDADAREKYLNRNRSGSQGTSSTDNKSQNGSFFSSAGPSADGDDISSLNHLASGSVTPRRLRPSMSATQLRTNPEALNIITSLPSSASESRSRAGTNPSAPRPTLHGLLSRSSSISTSPRALKSADQILFEESDSYTGPPSQYAQFPEPPLLAPDDSSTPTAGRRLAFHLLSKPPSNADPPNHRRGMSATSVRSP
ncbi:ankyrin repeat-containing domain protein [Mycena sp. CBHHK59/15]|nr:ankyrin repeat-containing domain protein [Mycena sp. CBHHK59/15]